MTDQLSSFILSTVIPSFECVVVVMSKVISSVIIALLLSWIGKTKEIDPEPVIHSIPCFGHVQSFKFVLVKITNSIICSHSSYPKVIFVVVNYVFHMATT